MECLETHCTSYFHCSSLLLILHNFLHMNQAGYLMLFKHDWKNNKNQQGSQNMKLTSLFRAEAEVPRSAGSMARRTSIQSWWRKIFKCLCNTTFIRFLWLEDSCMWKFWFFPIIFRWWTTQLKNFVQLFYLKNGDHKISATLLEYKNKRQDIK